MMPELFHDFQDPIAKEIHNNSFNNSTVKVEICISLGCQSVQYVKDDESEHSVCKHEGSMHSFYGSKLWHENQCSMIFW